MSRAEDDAIEALFASQRPPAPAPEPAMKLPVAMIRDALAACEASDRALERAAATKDLGLRRQITEARLRLVRTREGLRAVARQQGVTIEPEARR